MSARDKEIRETVDAAGRARDQKTLMIAMTALRDIAEGSGSVRVTDAMLASREVFREAFCCLLQAAARKALADIEALPGKNAIENARLIAAAPELYAALDDLVATPPPAEWGDPSGRKEWERMRTNACAALTKARGETS